MVFVASFLSLLGACGTPTIHAYPDAALSPDQVAILSVEVNNIFGVQAVLNSLDGKTMHEGLQLVNMRVQISPGPHRASVRFVEQKVIGSMSCSAEDKFVGFVAKPGHTYQLLATVQREYPCVFGGTNSWEATVADVTSSAQLSQK